MLSYIEPFYPHYAAARHATFNSRSHNDKARGTARCLPVTTKQLARRIIMLCDISPHPANEHAHTLPLLDVSRILLLSSCRIMCAKARPLAWLPDRVRVEVDLHERDHVLTALEPEAFVQPVSEVAREVEADADAESMEKGSIEKGGKGDEDAKAPYAVSYEPVTPN